jgi:3-dehydroquinate synthase
MAYTATLAHDRGMLSKEQHTRLLKLFSRAGLTIDHPTYDDSVIEMGTAAILKTRDGALRLAVPSPLGECQFVNEYTVVDLQRVLRVHKEYTAQYPRSGAGLEAYVDSSDTGETTIASANGTNGHADNHTNGNGQGNGNGRAIGNGHAHISNGVEKLPEAALNGSALNGSVPNRKKVQVQDAHQENGGMEDLAKELGNTNLSVQATVA